MSKTTNKLLQLSILMVVFLIAAPVTANPIHPYADPIALGDQAVDLSSVLAGAFQNTPWTLTREDDAHYLGNLSSKGFEVQVRISMVDNVLTMTLDSVTETGCADNCQDLGEEPVLRWLVSLRRNITFKLTEQVRDNLQ